MIHATEDKKHGVPDKSQPLPQVVDHDGSYIGGFKEVAEKYKL